MILDLCHRDLAVKIDEYTVTSELYEKEQLMTVNEMGRQNDELIVISNPHEEEW
jgi:hypothetical protein